MFIVISPRLSRYLAGKGYTVLPKDTMDYLTDLINQILSRRREHLERRNDFIQIMVDHEENVKQESAIDKQSEQTSTHDQRWGTLKKSRKKSSRSTNFHRSLSLFQL